MIQWSELPNQNGDKVFIGRHLKILESCLTLHISTDCKNEKDSLIGALFCSEVSTSDLLEQFSESELGLLNYFPFIYAIWDIYLNYIFNCEITQSVALKVTQINFQLKYKCQLIYVILSLRKKILYTWLFFFSPFGENMLRINCECYELRGKTILFSIQINLSELKQDKCARWSMGLNYKP